MLPAAAARRRLLVQKKKFNLQAKSLPTTSPWLEGRKNNASRMCRNKKKRKEDDLSFEAQIMIPVGRMYHCHRRNKGIHDRQYVMQSIVFRKDMSYQRVLEKCKPVVFPDEPTQNCEYYIANGHGMPICTDEYIRIDNEDGEEECIPWALDAYIKLLSIKYGSKAHFYCVKKYITVGEEESRAPVSDSERGHLETPQDTIAQGIEVTGGQYNQLSQVAGDEEEPSQVIGDREEELLQVTEEEDKDSHQVIGGQGEELSQVSGGQGREFSKVVVDHSEEVSHGCLRETPVPAAMVPDVAQESEVYTGFPNQAGVATFEPLFAHFRESRYAKKYIMVTNQTQKSVLRDRLDSDPDYMHEVRDVLESNPNRRVMFPNNPCNLGFWLVGIQNAVTGTAVVNLVQDYDMEKGEVLYNTPVEGSQLTLWCDVDSSQEDRVALLMCVATSGHHSIASYQWSKNGCDLVGEVHPLLYATTVGKYTCNVTSNQKSAKRQFEVTGSDGADFSACHITSALNAGLVCFKKDCLQPYKDILQNDCKDITQVTLLSSIGQGSFGTVYRATWRGSLVGAKVIQMGEESRHVIGEVERCRQVQHPNIIQVMGSQQQQGQVIILMALVDGPNLHDIIFSREQQLSEAIKLCFSLQLCQAVTFLHTSTPPVAHLDIKPSNILVDQKSSKILLEDFGLCQVMSGTNIVGTKTMMAGTPGYQPPEQLHNENVGLSSDIYALGAVLLVLFTGKQVWPGLSPFQIMYRVAVCNEKPQTLSLNQPIRDVCQACFNDLPLRPSASDVLQSLLKGVL